MGTEASVGWLGLVVCMVVVNRVEVGMVVVRLVVGLVGKIVVEGVSFFPFFFSSSFFLSSGSSIESGCGFAGRLGNVGFVCGFVGWVASSGWFGITDFCRELPTVDESWHVGQKSHPPFGSFPPGTRT